MKSDFPKDVYWDDVEHDPCQKCGTEALYFIKWDACFCPKCDEWLDMACDQECLDCHFNCAERPIRPSG